MAPGRVLQHGTWGEDVPGTVLAEALSLSRLVTAGSQEEQPKGTLSHSHSSRGVGDSGLSVCRSGVWV